MTAPTPEGHARQLAGISNRHPPITPSDLPRIRTVPTRPVNDYYHAADALRKLPLVHSVDVEHRPDSRLEIRCRRQAVPPAVMDVLVIWGLSIDPNETKTRPGECIAVAR